MKLTTLRMTLLVGLISVIFPFCQKSDLAIPNNFKSNLRDTIQTLPTDTTSHAPDSTIHIDTTVITPPADSTITTPKDSTITTPPVVTPPVVTPPVVTPPVVVPPVVVPPVVVPPVVVPPTPPASNTTDVGTGSGSLVIDGAGKTYACNAIIRIKGGTYSTITIKNVNGSNGCPVTIQNNGQIYVTGALTTDNISYVIIAGNGTTGITYGFAFENISFRAITMNRKMTGVTIRNMRFKNVADYCIAGEKTNGSQLIYDGTANTRTDGFKLLYCDFDNVGMIYFGGNLNKDAQEDSGFFKDVEIAYNSFKNTNAGSMCNFSNVQDYNIHHNTVDNVNYSNNNHNGIFYMQGNGTFHHNKLTNYQGNAIRAWVYSRGSSPATVEIYENTCYNTRKYGGFEIQGFARNIYPGKTTYANAKVYNNTVGKMNTSHDWDGQILDLYNFNGGSLEYYNNLGFDLYCLKSITNMINNMSDVKITREDNNKYSPVYSDVVTSLTSFVSKLVGIGAN